MDFIQALQERYIQEFSNNVPLGEFLLNIGVAALLAALIRLFYIHYGHALSNRRRFSANFLPLTLSTLLVIMIVKSSIALSLGLVGALSIVRFRAAIKDPEELVFLFMSIGVGLACGAGQPLLAVVALVVILAVMWTGRRFSRSADVNTESGRLFINISTDLRDLTLVSNTVMQHLSSVELRRMDTPAAGGLDLTYIGRATDLQQLSKLTEAVTALSPATRLSVIDQPDLIM
jgi:uncharacterized membrane protein YhiD involved in acid resistance